MGKNWPEWLPTGKKKKNTKVKAAKAPKLAEPRSEPVVPSAQRKTEG